MGFEAATTGVPFFVPDDHHVVVTGGRLGDGPRLGKIDPGEVEVYELESHLLGHAPHEIGLGDQLLGRQDPGDALTSSIVLLEHWLHVLEGHPAPVDQGLRQWREHGGSDGLVTVDRLETLLVPVLFLEGRHRLGDQVGGQDGGIGARVPVLRPVPTGPARPARRRRPPGIAP